MDGELRGRLDSKSLFWCCEPVLCAGSVSTTFPEARLCSMCQHSCSCTRCHLVPAPFSVCGVRATAESLVDGCDGRFVEESVQCNPSCEQNRCLCFTLGGAKVTFLCSHALCLCFRLTFVFCFTSEMKRFYCGSPRCAHLALWRCSVNANSCFTNVHLCVGILETNWWGWVQMLTSW